MALTKCPDCGRDVSDLALACPYCGRPVLRAARYAEPRMERCQVVLKTAPGMGLDFHWTLEAQVATPRGIVVVASCRYSSDNYLANFQSSKPQFLRARDQITEQLLRSGWELVDSSADTLALPRFQRPATGETEQLILDGAMKARRIRTNKLTAFVMLGLCVLVGAATGSVAGQTAGIAAGCVVYFFVALPIGLFVYLSQRRRDAV